MWNLQWRLEVVDIVEMEVVVLEVVEIKSVIVELADIGFVDVEFVDMGVVNGTYHTQLYDVTGKFIRSLSKGDFDDSNIYRHFSDNKVFIQSARPHNSDRSIYEVNIDSGEEKLLTSPLIKRDGKYFTASFSKRSKYSIFISHGPNLPEFVLKNNDVDDFMLESNEETSKNRESFGFNTFEFKTINIIQNEDNENRTDHKFELLIQYPPRFVEGKSYPTILNIYNGPGSQSIVKTFSKNKYRIKFYISQPRICSCINGWKRNWL